MAPLSRSLLASLAAAASLAAGCTADTDEPTPPADAAPEVPVTGTCDDDDLAAALAAWGGDGLAGAVVVDDPEGSCRLGVGRTGGEAGEPITVGTTFRIGSVTKAVVAAAVLRLEASGALSLDDPAGRHVAGLTGPAAAATVESLLLHTSGLVGSHGEDHVPLDRDEAVAAISGLPVDPAHVGRFLYSNAGYTLLALVLEGASGTDYRQLLREEVLPDGAGFGDDPAGTNWALQGNGDVAMSADALASWTREAFAGDLLPAAAVDRMLEPAVDDDGQGITVGWGRLDADVLGEVAVGAAGGGGDTDDEVVTVWLPASERVVVIATTTGAVTAEALLRTIGPAIVAGAPVPRPDDPVEVDDEVLDAAEGTYVLPSGDGFEVVRGDDGLVVTPSGGEALEALLPPDAPPAEVAAHEAAVATMLSGATDAGAEEVAILEEESGPLLEAVVLGTTDEGELRTYVELTFAEGRATGWYALDDAGGIAGVDLAGLPEVLLRPTHDGFRVNGRRPGGEAVVVTFDGDTMAVRGPGGTVVADRA